MRDGYTSLMLAARTGHVNVVQCLVEAEANIEAVDRVSGHLVGDYVDV
jgi:ankyrin repeat protein